MALVFDIETDGLLDQVTKVHCMVIKDTKTGEVLRCNDYEKPIGFTIHSGLEILTKAEEIVGHNIQRYDLPVLKKLYGFEPKGRVRDTLTCSRLIWSDLKADDFRLSEVNPKFPKQLIGRHSLESWGHRLGNLKGQYGKTADWTQFSDEMLKYCEQDVLLTADLWRLIQSKQYSEQAIELEHQFQEIIFKQEQHGFYFDRDKALKLYTALSGRRLEIEAQLQKCFPAWEIRTPFTPKVNNKARGYVKGVTVDKVEVVHFNPNSRQHVADRLQHVHGWKPVEFTEEGSPKVDEDVLGALEYPEAKLLAEHFMLQKRIGQLAEGNQAWIKLEKHGRIHGEVITNGAVTGRCTHNRPNIAQVPSIKNADGVVPYGRECRELFCVPNGWRLVGCDASGLELRCLAHYMGRYDGGAYGRELLSGDIHVANQKAAGLPARDNAKRFIYGYLYGAGDNKIGQIVGKGAEEGRKLKQQFLARTPALARLQRDIAAAVRDRGYLIGLDGRHLPIRSQHAALNTLLQSAGALIVKKATVIFHQLLKAKGLEWGKDYAQVAHIHDEIQTEAREDVAELVGQTCVEAMRMSGESFNLRIRIDGEYKIGRNWAECH